MNNICFNLGLQCIFIRYNPDNNNFTIKQKHSLLIKTLEKYLDYDFDEAIKIDYLFY